MTLLNLLAASSHATHQNIAVIDRNRSITYFDLHENTRRLSAVLQLQSVKPGDRIGIYLDKSYEAVLAILSILSTGATYVPIDSTLPAKRVDFLVRNCRLKGLITNKKNRDTVWNELSCITSGVIKLADNLEWCRFSCLSVSEECVDGMDKTMDIAYIMYTSGSSGYPKGVMVSHRAAVAFVEWAADYVGLNVNDRVSSHAPFHFDLSVFDIFATFKVGATLILIPPEISIFPPTLADWIHEQKISVWYSVPSVLIRLIIQGGLNRHTYTQLRQVLFAGEVFPVAILRDLQSTLPHVSFHNFYGPTESNVCSAYSVDIISDNENAPVPIGKACAGNQLVIVNEFNQLCKLGEIGEIWITGPTLMNGYWDMPQLTQEVFSKLSSCNHVTFYRSGDYGFEDQNGNFHYCGRRDTQIKMRGYRIELSEIESVLLLHPKILQAAAVKEEHDADDLRIGGSIKAYVVPRVSTSLTAKELQFFCSENLPSYMVPNTIEFRSSMPTTVTGKLDRAALLQLGHKSI